MCSVLKMLLFKTVPPSHFLAREHHCGSEHRPPGSLFLQIKYKPLISVQGPQGAPCLPSSLTRSPPMSHMQVERPECPAEPAPSFRALLCVSFGPRPSLRSLRSLLRTSCVVLLLPPSRTPHTAWLKQHVHSHRREARRPKPPRYIEIRALARLAASGGSRGDSGSWLCSLWGHPRPLAPVPFIFQAHH